MSLSWTRRLTILAAFGAVLGSTACLAEVPPSTPVLAGAYQLDPTHASVTFKISHFGLSNYTARFAKFDAKVNYDPAHPEKSTLEASVNPASIRTDYPTPEKVDFDKELGGEKWFNVAKFPQANFQSSSVKSLGGGKYQVSGKLTIKGNSKDVEIPVALTQANGVTSASGQYAIKRLVFKIGEGEWADTSMVADDVQVKFKLAVSGMGKL